MTEIRDTIGRVWSITLNVLAAQRVRDLAKYDLLNIFTANPAKDLLFDPILVGNVLAALVHDQLEARKIDKDRLLESLDGQTIDAARSAIVEEIDRFFQNRAGLTKWLNDVMQSGANATPSSSVGNSPGSSE